MRTTILGQGALAVLSLLNCLNLGAATRYVWPDSPNAAPPYTDWAHAAHVIQDAVDASAAGDEIVVTNGVYATGGRAVYGIMTNRVAVDKPVEVRSLNGPNVTVIQGFQPPGGNEDGAVRCVYLANGALLSGFTLRGGATRASGDLEKEQSGGGLWCEIPGAGATNCVLTGNCASYSGGGAFRGNLNNCAVTTNTVSHHGGGVYSGCVINCRLSGNSANVGGGAYNSLLTNCVITGNAANNGNVAGEGGGAYYGTLNNCTLTGNSATSRAGGVCYGTLNNCTIVSNSAAYLVGGAYNSVLNNCIVYYNARANYLYMNAPFTAPITMYYCCTTPLPAGGTGNISSPPLFVDLMGGNLRLQSNSPCVNVANNAYASGTTDLDGNPRIVGIAVDMGAYEFQTHDVSRPFFAFSPFTQSGAFPLWVTGIQRPGAFVLEFSTDLKNWIPILTNTSDATSLGFTDDDAGKVPRRFYRGVQQ